MTYLSLFEKIKILMGTIFDFKVVLIFSIILLILTVLYMIKVLDKKKYTLSMIGSFITVFAVSIISNFKILSNGWLGVRNINVKLVEDVVHR